MVKRVLGLRQIFVIVRGVGPVWPLSWGFHRTQAIRDGISGWPRPWTLSLAKNNFFVFKMHWPDLGAGVKMHVRNRSLNTFSCH